VVGVFDHFAGGVTDLIQADEPGNKGHRRESGFNRGLDTATPPTGRFVYLVTS
jgi:hypothetical protein